MKNKLQILGSTILWLLIAPPSHTLPPPEDIPEEILRTEIILEGRSPIDGKPLTASEYTELQAQIGQKPFPPQLTPQVREIIFLLGIRKFIKTVTPF
ncbi:MAG: hypothetical protein QNJ41_05745 [Xenococcaceae cyanobacterium MO_188.B32]|nr:hypothetical protein [Xenococcaceae cyanobacterium MO_188.B32]